MVLFRARRVSQAYTVVLALGCLAGLGWLALRRGVSAGDEAHSLPAALLALAVGLVGARLAFAALHGPYFLGNPIEVVWLCHGGLSWVGGVLGALVAVGLYAGIRRLRLAPLADALTLPALLVALSAWTGCLLESCVYGRPVPASLFAPPSADLFGVSAPRWPTAAVGMIATGLLVCSFLWMEGRNLASGRRAVVALAGLGAIALALSLTRADPVVIIVAILLEPLGAEVILG